MTHKPKCLKLFVSRLFLLNCGMSAIAQKATMKNEKTPFAGIWSYATDKYNFDVTIMQYGGDSIRGTYCAASQKWADCWDSGASYCVLTGRIKFNTATITFNSNFSDEQRKDTAIIFYNRKDGRLLWERKTYTIVAHVPDKAVLERDVLSRN